MTPFCQRVSHLALARHARRVSAAPSVQLSAHRTGRVQPHLCTPSLERSMLRRCCCAQHSAAPASGPGGGRLPRSSSATWTRRARASRAGYRLREGLHGRVCQGQLDSPRGGEPRSFSTTWTRRARASHAWLLRIGKVGGAGYVRVKKGRRGLLTVNAPCRRPLATWPPRGKYAIDMRPPAQETPS